jgi:P4 family phage/plasmid primase-like protien
MQKTTALQLFDAGFTQLVCVSPPNAKLSERSNIPPEAVGKAPARRNASGEWGGYDWRKTPVFRAHAELWGSQGANIGLAASNFPALDIDVTDETLAKIVQDAALLHLGPAPIRTGRAPKRLLVYRTAQPFGRLRLWLTDSLTGERHLLEFLGDGQQYVVAGVHPSGSTYGWDKPLHALAPSQLCSVKPEDVDFFFKDIEAAADLLGYTASREGNGSTSIDRDGVNQTGLQAPSFEACAEAVNLIPNTNENCPGRDDYLRLGYAIKASVGEAGFDLFLEWAMRWEGNGEHPGNDPDVVAADWARMVPPYELGWDYVATMARGHGYADFAEDFGNEGLLPPPPQAETPPAAQKADAPAEAEADPDFAPIAYSDGALSRRTLNRLGGNFRFCEGLGGWLFYDKGRWHRDGEMLFYSATARVGRAMAEEARNDPDLDKNKRAVAMGMCSNRVVQNSMQYSRSDKRVRVEASDFDADLMQLNTPDGIVSLHDGTLRPHDAKALHTRMAAVTPSLAAAPVWTRFLQETTADDEGLQKYLQLLAGYALTGSTREHQMTFIWGPGGNGKSVFVNTIMSAMGDYAMNTPSNTFSARSDNAHPEGLARLRGARLVVASETQEGLAWNEALVKQVTGGDIVTARFMHQGSFEYKPQFKLIVMGNHKPRLANMDNGMKRRLQMVPFTVMPKNPDRDLENKLRAELPQILQWMIEGCRMWDAGGLQLPEIVSAATAEYFVDEDPVGRFIEDRCVARHDATVQTSALFEAWREWAEDQNESPRTQRWLTNNLLNRAGVTRWRNPINGQRGIAGLELLYDAGEFAAQPAPAGATA